MPSASSQEYGTVVSVNLTDDGCLVLVQLNTDPPGSPPHPLLEPAGDFAAWNALVNMKVLVTLTATT